MDGVRLAFPQVPTMLNDTRWLTLSVCLRNRLGVPWVRTGKNRIFSVHWSAVVYLLVTVYMMMRFYYARGLAAVVVDWYGEVCPPLCLLLAGTSA